MYGTGSMSWRIDTSSPTSEKLDKHTHKLTLTYKNIHEHIKQTSKKLQKPIVSKSEYTPKYDYLQIIQNNNPPLWFIIFFSL